MTPDQEATVFALTFAIASIGMEGQVPVAGERHLILDSAAAARGEMLVKVACSDTFEPHNQARHTYLTAATTCPACRTVNEARIAVLNSEEL